MGETPNRSQGVGGGGALPFWGPPPTPSPLFLLLFCVPGVDTAVEMRSPLIPYGVFFGGGGEGDAWGGGGGGGR